MEDRTAARRAVALERIRAIADHAGVAGVVLTRPSSVAWATSGMNPPIDRTASIDTVWLAVGPRDVTVVTTTVERPRLIAELVPTGISVVEVDWFDADAFVTAAASALNADPKTLASDGHSAFGVDVSDDLVSSRLALSPAEQIDIAELAADATQAVEQALLSWTPGESDFDIAARVIAATEAVGAEAPVLLVGGDERLARFRHPVANGARPTNLVMVVLVARRTGLHVALTRYAATALTPTSASQITLAQTIHVDTLEAVRVGNTYGSVMHALDSAYQRAGHPGEWRYHYQGGPIGFGQREFEIAPFQTGTPWSELVIEPGVAVAYNPSLPGGAKDEDTYLVTSDGELQWLTTSANWPTAMVAGRVRPTVLMHS